MSGKPAIHVWPEGRQAKAKQGLYHYCTLSATGQHLSVHILESLSDKKKKWGNKKGLNIVCLEEMLSFNASKGRSTAPLNKAELH